MPSLTTRYQKNPHIVSRKIVGEVILVPIRQNVGDLESIYTLNETAALAWTLFDGERTLADIRDRLAAEFEVDADQAARDLDELAAQLSQIGAITEV